MLYSKTYTLRTILKHQKKTALISLIDSIDKEDNKKAEVAILNLATNCTAIIIDMDEIELISSRKKRRPNKSVDCAFAINNGRIFFVLCEYRFNFSQIGNVTQTTLNEKVLKSSAHIKSWGEQVYQNIYFIFAQDMYQEALRRFRRMNPECNPNYIPTTCTNIINMFFK